jgi:aminopeptidase N
VIRKGLKPFMRELSAKQLKRLGWKELAKDTHFDKLLRPTILGLASYGGEQAVVDEALRLFKNMKKPEDINPDIRGVVYGTVSRKGTVEDFDKMLTMHNTSTNSEERVTLASALTNFRQADLIERALSEITSSDVRLQDVPYWIAYSFMNRKARQATWSWLKEHWDWLSTNLGTDLSFYRIPNYVARTYSDIAFLDEFTEFFTSRMSPAFERPVKQAIETITWQAAWKDRDLRALKEFFSAYLDT